MCALSMVLVFRDVCPGYRIRPPTEKELAMKVTKETQKLRDFEAGLLKMYQSFVRTVVRCGGGKKSRSQRGKGGPEAGVALMSVRASRGVAAFQLSNRRPLGARASPRVPGQRRRRDGG